MEIKKDGIALYEADDTDLHTPRPKTPARELEAAREYFEDHYPGAIVWLNTSRDLAKQKRPKEAAFLLHQATERLYAGLLLTLTYYAPYGHDIAFLRSLAEGLDRRLYGIWPEDTRRERAMFQKLKEAYTKARYSKNYRISEEEFDWLGETLRGTRSHRSHHLLRAHRAARTGGRRQRRSRIKCIGAKKCGNVTFLNSEYYPL